MKKVGILRRIGLCLLCAVMLVSMLTPVSAATITEGIDTENDKASVSKSTVQVMSSKPRWMSWMDKVMDHIWDLFPSNPPKPDVPSEKPTEPTEPAPSEPESTIPSTPIQPSKPSWVSWVDKIMDHIKEIFPVKPPRPDVPSEPTEPKPTEPEPTEPEPTEPEPTEPEPTEPEPTEPAPGGDTVTAVDVIYVSAEAVVGEGDGTLEQPFANIEEAKNLVRAIKEADKYPEGGITVFFREGQYFVDKSIVFDEADSGEEGAPVVYSAYQDEKVVFIGGIDIDMAEFSAVTDPAIKDRLAEGASDKVKQYDLAALGITNYGEMNVYGHSLIVLNNWAHLNVPDEQPPELLFDGETMSIARWPNDGTVNIEAVVDTGDVVIDWFEDRSDPKTLIESKWVADPEGATFTVNADVAARMANWTEADDIWAYGYWKETWSDQSLPIESLDAETGTVKAGIPSAYGTAAGRGFYFYNLLEEVDTAGEYYIDRTSGILYFYPSKTSGTASLTLLDEAMISLTEGIHDISFEGIELESGLSHGISLDGANRVSISNCDISKFADKGIKMKDSTDVVITGSHLYDLGTGGVHIETSEEFHSNLMKTLESTGIVVENCEIHNFARITKTYSPAVYTGGVGTIVRNCKIYDAACNAITLVGNDTLIENNEIFDVLQEDGDKGVFYGGAAKETMGIMIRNNYIHDISTSSDGKIYVVYADDTKDGVSAESNLIVNFAGTAHFVNGGWDNNFRNNVLINCDATATITAAGVSAGRDVATDGIYERFRYVYANYFDLYNEKYPHWEGKLEDLIQRNTCKYNVIEDNVVINVDEGIYTVDWEKSMLEEIYANNTLEDGNSYSLADVGFANIDNGDYTIDEDGAVCVTSSDFTIAEDSIIFDDIEGFKAYDLSRIGLIDGTIGIPGPLGALYEEEDEEEPAPGVLVSENFSDLTDWVDISNDKTDNYNYAINANGQLEISLDAGRANDVILKYNKTFDGTKKTAIEFDFKVNGEATSNFETGLELKNGAKWTVVVGASKGKLKAQWSGKDAAIDSNIHKVKFVTDPLTNTIDIYLDGVLVVEDAAYLQSQTSWDTLTLFAKGNNTTGTLSVCFDNLTVTEVQEIPEPEEPTPEEPTPDDALLFENFSTVDNWSSVTGSAGNWSYASNEGQLQISVDPGTQNIAKIYSNEYGWDWIQNKISIEFDIVNVSKDTNSDFVAGFSLMSWNTNVFTVNVHKGILRTNWTGTGIDVSDGVHRVKIVSDPAINTFSVYLDGELIKEGVGYLTGSSWNRFGFFADTNNSQNTMSACFDNLIVKEVQEIPDPVFDTISVNELVEDEENWQGSTGATVAFENGTVNVSGPGDGNGNALIGYKGKTYKNTVFNFTYKQENTSNSWGGFGIQLSPTAMPWTTKSVLICLKEDKVELQYWANEYSGIIEKNGNYLKDGVEQEITFGMYDLNPETNEVRIVLSIDGTEIFNQVVNDAVLSGFEGYFVAIGSMGVKASLGKAIEVAPTHTVVMTEQFATLPQLGSDLTTDKTENFEYIINTNGQLEITLNAGRTNDVVLMYNGTVNGKTYDQFDRTKKTIIEFDLKVDNSVDSNFEAALELKNWNTTVASIGFGKGQLKAQWGFPGVNVDDQIHRVKVVSDPVSKTISVYLDGELALNSGGYLQDQTSWNQIAFLAKGNNGENAMSACFDNLTVTIEE